MSGWKEREGGRTKYLHFVKEKGTSTPSVEGLCGGEGRTIYVCG
jgi:hypothetical protein